MFKSKIFTKAILIVATSLILFAISIYLFIIPKIDNTIESLEERNAKAILSKVTLIVKNVNRDLVSYKNAMLTRHKEELKHLTYSVYSILDEQYKQSTKKNEQKVKNNVLKLVNSIRYGDNNYFYISNLHNVLISHPYLQGVDMSDIKDVKGNLIVPPMVKLCLKRGEGFYSYWWKKNKADNTLYEKLTFSKFFAPWNMVIGTGVYIDEIDKEVQKRQNELMHQLRKIITTTKIGKTGYLYLFNGSGKMLVHPNSNIDNTNFKKLKNPTKKSYIFDDLVKVSKGSKELFYKWDKPTDKGNYIYRKISWVEYIPELDWYLVSSAYVDEFKDSSKKITLFIAIIAFVLILLSAIYSYFFLKNLLRPVINISKNAAMGEMISIIAHQWRQPLNELGLVLQKFEFAYDKGLLDKEFVQNETDKGKKLIVKMSSTIDTFKNFLDLQKKSKPFDVAVSVENVIMLLEDTNRLNKINICFDSKNTKIINSFQGEFEHAILNIINNATDILLKQSSEKKVISIEVEQRAKRVHITICDNGGGVAEHDMKYIFDPHYTTKKNGSGIGLYITKKIIEEHMGGEVSITNKTFTCKESEHFGACFEIIV